MSEVGTEMESETFKRSFTFLFFKLSFLNFMDRELWYRTGKVNMIFRLYSQFSHSLVGKRILL